MRTSVGHMQIRKNRTNMTRQMGHGCTVQFRQPSREPDKDQDLRAFRHSPAAEGKAVAFRAMRALGLKALVVGLCAWLLPFLALRVFVPSIGFRPPHYRSRTLE